LDYIAGGIKYLVNDYKDDPDNDGKLGLSGTPYLNFKLQGDSTEESGIARNLDFIDTACMVLTSLLDAKAINYERQCMIKDNLIDKKTPEIIPKDLLSKVDLRITDAANFINECDLGPGKGWAYTNDPLEQNRQDQLYFTWNVLESLEVFQDYIKKSIHLVPKTALENWGGSKASNFIGRKLTEKLSYLSAKFLSPDNKNLYICENKVDFGEDDKIWYYNLFAIIGLLITDSKDTQSLGNSLQYIISNFEKTKTFEELKTVDAGKFWIASDEAFLQKHKKRWHERAIIALLIKALALYKKNHESSFTDMVKQLENFNTEEDLLIKYLEVIGNDRIIIEDYEIVNIWDKQESPAQYSIYYTQRVIESLVKLYSVLYPSRKVDAYFEKSQIKQQGDESLVPMSTQAVQITIDGDWIKEKLIKQTTKEIENKVKEMLGSDDFSNLIQDEVKLLLDKNVDLKIQHYFGFVLANLSAKKPEKEYIKFIDSLGKIIKELAGEQLLEIIAVALGRIAKESNQEINEKRFAERFQKAMEYVIEWENRTAGSIDWGTTFSKMETSIVQFSNAELKNESKK